MDFWQGKTIALRAFEPEDYDIFFETLKDASIQKYESDLRAPMSLEACKAFALSQSQRGNGIDDPFLIIVDQTGNRVGIASPSIEDKRVGVFTCGISIKPEYQRRGYASEALKLIWKFYFDQMRCVKFSACVYDYNAASYKLCAKLGLVVEGAAERRFLQMESITTRSYMA